MGANKAFLLFVGIQVSKISTLRPFALALSPQTQSSESSSAPLTPTDDKFGYSAELFPGARDLVTFAREQSPEFQTTIQLQ